MIKERQIEFENNIEDDRNSINCIIDYLKQLKVIFNNLDFEMENFVSETIQILETKEIDSEVIKTYPFFCKSFGRSQQYISFVKA